LGCDISRCLLICGGPTELHIVTTEHHNPNTHSCVKVKSTDHKLFALTCRIRSLCSVDRKGEVPFNPKQQEQDCKYCVPWQSTQMLPRRCLQTAIQFYGRRVNVIWFTSVKQSNAFPTPSAMEHTLNNIPVTQDFIQSRK